MSVELTEDLQKELNKLLMHHSDLKRYKDMITKAFKFAVKAHEKVKRKSGEIFVMHPIRVAHIINEMKADYETICAALLHDTIEDNHEVTYEMVAEEFGTHIADMVDDVTKFSLKGATKEDEVIKTINKNVLSLLKNPRSICIKLADRLDNMRTIGGHEDPQKRIDIAEQTLGVYVPLARMLSMYKIAEELEKLSFEVLQKDKGLTDLEKLKKERKEKYEENDKVMAFIGKITQTDMISKILRSFDSSIELVSSNPLKHVNFKFKSYYQINEKMKNLNKEDMDDIHDLIKIRINLNNVEDCYKAVKAIESYCAQGEIEEFFGKPIYYKDYIKKPAFNGYQSIHARYNVKSINKIIQIEYRTFAMKNRSEEGIASCWNYDYSDPTKAMLDFLYKQPFYEDLSELANIYANESREKKKDQKIIERELFQGFIRRIFSKRIKVLFDNEEFQTYKGCTLIELLRKKHPEYIDDYSIFERNGIAVTRFDEIQDEDIINRYVQEVSEGMQRTMVKRDL